jgi:hypothetical protein
VYRNEGDPDYRKNHSGSGLLLADTDGAIIERTVAWENGRLCYRAPGGPCGIWAAGSNNVVIQHCESFRNHTGKDSADGDGFDLDGGVTNSIVQYNYSHDNDGYGFLLCSYKGAPHPWRNNIVRFNISDNDGRAAKPSAGIAFWTDGPELEGVQIYNNTIISDPGPEWVLAAAIRATGPVDGARVFNNLLIATSGSAFIDNKSSPNGIRFEGNAYWTEGGPVRIHWAGQEYNSIEAWRKATGQETRDGADTSVTAAPRLPLAGRGMTVADPMRLSTMPGYRIPGGSPLAGAGVFAPNLGPHDFFGTPLRKDRPFIGAAQPPNP